VGENVRGELVGKDFDKWWRVKVGATVEVRQVNRTKEKRRQTVRHDRVEQDIDGRERDDLGRGGGGRGKTVTTRSAANTTVYARRVAAGGRGAGDHFSFATGL
jgi:hypothetical protein